MIVIQGSWNPTLHLILIRRVYTVTIRQTRIIHRHTVQTVVFVHGATKRQLYREFVYRMWCAMTNLKYINAPLWRLRILIGLVAGIFKWRSRWNLLTEVILDRWFEELFTYAIRGACENFLFNYCLRWRVIRFVARAGYLIVATLAKCLTKIEWGFCGSEVDDESRGVGSWVLRVWRVNFLVDRLHLILVGHRVRYFGRRATYAVLHGRTRLVARM